MADKEMSTMIEILKQVNGYTEYPRQCKDCISFMEDDSTDNFGPGDMCIRNLDIGFAVRKNAVCNKWVAK